MITELVAAAGDRADILAGVAGSWAGYYGDQDTADLATALLDLPGAAAWVDEGRARRSAGVHGAGGIHDLSARRGQTPHR